MDTPRPNDINNCSKKVFECLIFSNFSFLLNIFSFIKKKIEYPKMDKRKKNTKKIKPVRKIYGRISILFKNQFKFFRLFEIILFND